MEKEVHIEMNLRRRMFTYGDFDSQLVFFIVLINFLIIFYEIASKIYLNLNS